MQASLDEAHERRIEQVRLVQSPSHLRSLALYMKLGFEVREPLVLVRGKPSGQGIAGCDVRLAAMDDIPGCNRLCIAAHGFARSFELRLMHRLDSGHFAIEDSLSEIVSKMIAFHEKHVAK